MGVLASLQSLSDVIFCLYRGLIFWQQSNLSVSYRLLFSLRNGLKICIYLFVLVDRNSKERGRAFWGHHQPDHCQLCTLSWIFDLQFFCVCVCSSQLNPSAFCPRRGPAAIRFVSGAWHRRLSPIQFHEWWTQKGDCLLLLLLCRSKVYSAKTMALSVQ